ncbi:unnamed protein product, partial [Prorocentrum cordatum]
DLAEHCRKQCSRDGILCDLELGLDPANYVCAATWAVLVHLAGLQPASNNAELPGTIAQ